MRDPTFETEFLRQVARQAGLSGLTEQFVAACAGRLAKGAQEYGGDDAFVTKAPDWLLKNAAEEGIDLPAWALLFAQLVRGMAARGELDPDAVQLATAHVLDAAACALRAWYSISKASEVLDGA